MRVTLSLLLSTALASSASPVEILQSVGALPAHIAGRFRDITGCAQSPDGEYVIFDRRAHTVYSVSTKLEIARELVQIGAEPGRVLSPSAFDLADDGTFVVADAPRNRGRIQVFFSTGATLGGFTLPGRELPTITLDGVVTSGIGSIEYTGQSVLLNRPEVGALVTEYALDGRVIRTFGELRATGHEQDTDLHLALNAGIIAMDARGGFYFVFVAGIPMFRKYDAAGELVYERHIEGTELDEYVRTIPTTWPKRPNAGGELPFVQPVVRAAATDRVGNLWISLRVPYTYVYDATGDKRRTVQFRATGIIAPNSFFFTRERAVVVTPGCYAFEARESKK